MPTHAQTGVSFPWDSFQRLGKRSLLTHLGKCWQCIHEKSRCGVGVFISGPLFPRVEFNCWEKPSHYRFKHNLAILHIITFLEKHLFSYLYSLTTQKFPKPLSTPLSPGYYNSSEVTTAFLAAKSKVLFLHNFPSDYCTVLPSVP